MAPLYQILSEFTEEKDPDQISTSPYWAVAVVRFAQPLTFSRSKMFAGETSTSYSKNSEDLIRERAPLIISSDVLQMQIDASKSNYTTSLSATLANGPLNYLYEIQPDDWVFAWIVNNQAKFDDILARIRDGKAANNFDDGLKFVGRVQSIRKRLTQSADGHRTVRYQLNAAGFKELDASTFYDPALVKEEQSLGQFLTEMNVELDDVFSDAGKSSHGLSTTKLIPRLLKIMLGEGVPPDAATFGDVQIATGLTQTPEAPYAFAVPPTALKLLGQLNQHKTVPSVSDMLELVIGLQKYHNASGANTPTRIFTPDGPDSSTNFRILNEKLLGSFLPLPLNITGKSVWSLMEEFNNPACNEMYTALRVNPQGRVVPTIIVRQLPFSTPIAMEKGDPESLTGHLELPRWVAHPILINSMDIGKSDALHFNFIHFYGQASAEGGVGATNQIIINPPIRDEQDIKRSGLRPFMQTVACSIDDTLNEPGEWMKIASDFYIGQQYALTGSCDMIGIAAPICPGDNFEFDDVVYHIESVTHACSIQNGQKQFNTTLNLTYGMRSDSDSPVLVATKEVEMDLNKEALIYAGMRPNDMIGFDPGQTNDNREEQKDPNGSKVDNQEGVFLPPDSTGAL